MNVLCMYGFFVGEGGSNIIVSQHKLYNSYVAHTQKLNSKLAAIIRKHTDTLYSTG